MEFKQDTKHTKLFTRRAFFMGFLQLSFVGVLSARLAWLQISQGKHYKTLADKNRINIKVLPPPRGRILDRFGIPLAINDQNFRVMVIPEQAENLQSSLQTLQKLINFSDAHLLYIMEEVKKVPKYVPVEIKDNLSWEEVSTIEVNLPSLPGLTIDVGEIRRYPYGEDTAHIVGYVSAVTESELDENPFLNMPGFKTGKTGIEKTHEDIMRGQPGSAQVEVNVIGREVRELKRSPSASGQDVRLTLDIALQQYAYSRLAQHKSASAVVMDVQTGAIYAMASHPSFDPNLFTQGLSAEQWEQVLATPGHPLNNKTISGQYPPGSTFKMITGLAGLKYNKTNLSRQIFCPGHYDFGRNRFHCWKRGGHGAVNLTQAIEQSCDVYFYQVGLDTGIERLAEVAREFGFDKQLGIELDTERPGIIPDPLWKMGISGQNWHKGETINASIGQGDVLTTPLQLAVMTARLVNGGVAVQPTVIQQIGEQPKTPESWAKIDIQKSHLEYIKRGMDMVVNSPTGTAVGSKIYEEEYAMGGKTGTAQVRRITMEQRRLGLRNEDLPWNQRHHALFVGYAPVGAPKYACAVVVEHGVGGSKTAAPLAKEILLETQKRRPEQSSLSLSSNGENKVQQ